VRHKASVVTLADSDLSATYVIIPSMTTPFFSVIIPVYNGMATLRRCLVAVQQSTFTDWELIVVDDGSTDGSGPLAAEFGAMVLHTAGQQGPAAARNLGAQAARG